MPTDIVIVSDMHIGSTVALCPPTVTLDDGGTYHASRGQRWLWSNWLQFVNEIGNLQKPILVLNGDAIEQDVKRRSYQVITRNPATVQRIAVQVLDPLVKLCDRLYVIRGTAAHGGKSGNQEELLAEDLDAVQNTDKAYSRYHLPLVVEGVRLDIAHHASMGSSPTSKPLAVMRLAWQTMLEYQVERATPPDIVIRGHQHRWADSYDAYPTRAIYSAGWTLATEYIEARAPGRLADIGGIILHIDGGTCEVEKLAYKPRRAYERL